MNSTDAISGVDYAKLNATLARYFENSTLVEKAKTQAIVVIYKVRSGKLGVLYIQHHTCDMPSCYRRTVLPMGISCMALSVCKDSISTSRVQCLYSARHSNGCLVGLPY